MSVENRLIETSDFLTYLDGEVATLKQSGQQRINLANSIENVGIGATAGGALSFTAGIIIEALANSGPHNLPEDAGFLVGLTGLVLFAVGGELRKKFTQDTNYNVAHFLETGEKP